MANNRLLLCRPHGGLNDMLCQIEHACRYGERFDRHVIIETDSPTTRSFKDRLANYFVCPDPRISLDAREFSDRFDGIEVYPHAVRGRVNSYSARFSPDKGNYADEQTGALLRFDLDRDYPEPLLLHHTCGGGSESVAALRRMRLHDAITDELMARLRCMPRPYTAIHIRDTDYRTRYREPIRDLAPKILDPVFVATDNRDAVEFCRTVFGEDRTFSFATLPVEPGKTLHHNDRIVDIHQRNTDSILDLLMLALSRVFIFFELMENNPGTRHSGFSVLAHLLKESPSTLGQLISRRDSAIDPALWPRDFRRMVPPARPGG